MKNKCFTLVELMLVVAIIGLLIGIVVPNLRLITIMPSYSSGERTGVVVKLSKNGMFYKTWEGSMNVGSMSTDGQGIAVPTVFDFSVSDESVVQKIQESSQAGKKITLFYNQALIRSFKEGETNYLIVGVK